MSLKRFFLIFILFFMVANLFFWYKTGVMYFEYGTPKWNTQDFAKISDVLRVYKNFFGNNNYSSPRNKESCEKIGGAWGPAGLFPEEICSHIPASDFGKICTHSNQCQGYCSAEEYEPSTGKGKCSKYSATLGCRKEIIESKIIDVCID